MLHVHLISISNAYYLSPNAFTFDQGEYFCQTQCTSNLASIHNESQFIEAIKVIQDQPSLIIDNDINVFIGLIHPRSIDNIHIWNWTDGTPFDFGKNISGAIYPWGKGYETWKKEPKRNLTDEFRDCVVIAPEPPYSYNWSDSDCTKKGRVLCNHCDGILNKYIIANKSTTNIDRAIQECSSLTHAPSLSSFHNERDFEELRMLCETMSQSFGPVILHDCWTGLYTNDEWKTNDTFFDDNTTFDFGTDTAPPNIDDAITQYPWELYQPRISHVDSGGNQAIIHYPSYLLSDDYSNISYTYPICNMPSELCNLDTSETNMIAGDQCVLHTDAKNVYSGIMFNTMQFYNGNKLLQIDLTFRIFDFNYNITNKSSLHYKNQHREMGINIRSCYTKYYSIGLYHNNNNADHPSGVLLQYFNGTKKESTTILGWGPMDWALIDPSIYYRLNAKIYRINHTHLHFNISFNNTISIAESIDIRDIKDDTNDAFNLNKDGYSGYIQLYTQHSEVEFKSLYVSGTKLQKNSIDICTSAPTVNPTANPTELPTSMPTNGNILIFSLPTTIPTSMSSRSETNSTTSINTSGTLSVDSSIGPLMIIIYVGSLLCCCVLILIMFIKYRKIKKSINSTNTNMVPQTSADLDMEFPGLQHVQVVDNEEEQIEGGSDMIDNSDLDPGRELHKKESRKAEEMYSTEHIDHYIITNGYSPGSDTTVGDYAESPGNV